MKRSFRLWSLALALVSAPAAAGRTISAEPVDDVKIRIDGDLREWPNKMTDLGDTLEGKASGGDPRVAATVAYDEGSLYVVLKVFDKKIVRSAAAGDKEDHATLYLSFPKGETYALDLFPGQPGKVAGAVKLKGTPVGGAKIVEAPTEKGLAVEAQIPWTAFPEAARTRVGLRATLTYTDSDAPGNVNAVIGTATARSGKGMPPLLLANEQGLQESIIKAKGLPPSPAREAYGNVSGDGMVERVAVWGGNLVIIGPHFRGGKEFYFADLGVDDAAKVSRLSLVDFDADGRDEIVVQKKVGATDKYREVLTVIKVGKDDQPFLAFAHEVGIKTADGEIANKVKISKSGIEIAQGESDGFDPGTFSEVQPGDMGATLLPWESVGSRTFTWKGKGFEPSGETGFTPKQSASGSSKKPKPKVAKSDEPPAPPAPRPPSADELLDRVYALYKKDRGVSGKPSFDFVTDVAGDRGPERVLIHGKDMVVFGKGFREGLSYAFIAIGVADAKDILDATARDLTGDGKAEIIVRAVLHAKASKALGGDTVDRHALYVYGVQGDGIVRVFAAETGRALGKDQIIGAVAFTPAKRGFEIELRPSRAIGWTEQSYPFPVDTTAAGGLEPLLLPWTSGSRKYRYDGKAFTGP
ncbi:MAG: uncharacterized protein K0R38_2074 [Polyangiaceae bacterium]|jgi:hypothetical protein|nr:uncharacterized protein [Polyangiaceae bacterium]